MISKFKTALKALRHGEKGITGLETAIILIAFVVVASIFAYTVLSAGMYSSQSSQQAVYSGLTEARSPVSLGGFVVAKTNSGATDVDTMVFTVQNSLDGIGIDFTAGGQGDGLNVVVISYHSANEVEDDLSFTSSQVAWGDNDSVLEAGEKMEITVDLTSVTELIEAYDTIAIELKPPRGSVLKIERVMPAQLDNIMILQ